MREERELTSKITYIFEESTNIFEESTSIFEEITSIFEEITNIEDSNSSYTFDSKDFRIFKTKTRH